MSQRELQPLVTLRFCKDTHRRRAISARLVRRMTSMRKHWRRRSFETVLPRRFTPGRRALMASEASVEAAHRAPATAAIQEVTLDPLAIETDGSHSIRPMIAT
jgi:hypothetical protein